MIVGNEKRVLLAIDDVALREQLASELRQRRIEVIESNAGRDAVDLVGRQHPAVVIVSSAEESPAAFSLISGAAHDQKSITLLVTDLRPADLEPFSAHIHGITSKRPNVAELSGLVQMCCDIRERRGLELMALAVVAGGLLGQW